MNKLTEYQTELINQTIDELLDEANFTGEDQAKKLERIELVLNIRDFRDRVSCAGIPYPPGQRHPEMIRQTSESAAGISKQLREGLANDELDRKPERWTECCKPEHLSGGQD